MDNVKQPLGIEVQNIECSQICFSGASMSQVVDRFVFDKIQSITSSRNLYLFALLYQIKYFN